MLADVCRQVALMQRFTLFTFSTRTQNCQFGDLFKIISPTTFPTASGTFENSIKGQLAARELPRTRALLEDFYGATGHGKDLKIGSAAFLFTLSLPLCLCVFEASRDLCVATTVKKRANLPRGRTEKRGFDLQLAIKMLPSSPIRFSVYPV